MNLNIKHLHIEAMYYEGENKQNIYIKIEVGLFVCLSHCFSSFLHPHI